MAEYYKAIALHLNIVDAYNNQANTKFGRGDLRARIPIIQKPSNQIRGWEWL